MSGTNPAQDRLDRLAGYDARDYEPAQSQNPDPAEEAWMRPAEGGIPYGTMGTHRDSFIAGYRAALAAREEENTRLDEAIRDALDVASGWTGRPIAEADKLPAMVGILNRALEAALAALPTTDRP